MDLVDLVPAGLGSALQARSPSGSDGSGKHAASDDGLWGNSDVVRRAALGLGIVSVVGAVLVLGWILYDSWRATKGLTKKASRKRCSLPVRLHPADVVPLIVTVAVILQGTVLAAVEGATVSGAVQNNCVTTARVVWLAIWLVPYTLIVFSFEAVLRGLKPGKCSTRQKGTVRIGILTVVMMLCVTWFSLGVVEPSQRCRASLAWWASSFYALVVPIVCALLIISTVSAMVVIVQLVRKTRRKAGQRLALAQTLCYLGVLITFSSFVLPFFVEVARHRVTQATPAMATIAFNTLGLVLDLCYVAFRVARADGMRLPRPLSRPSFLSHRSNRSPDINNGDSEKRILTVTSPLSSVTADTKGKRQSRVVHTEVIRSPELPALSPGLPALPKPIYSPSPGPTPRAPSSSSTLASSATLPLSPGLDDFDDASRLSRVSTDSGSPLNHGMSMLLPPAPAFAVEGATDRSRSASVVTSATVEIGLQVDHSMEHHFFPEEEFRAW